MFSHRSVLDKFNVSEYSVYWSHAYVHRTNNVYVLCLLEFEFKKQRAHTFMFTFTLLFTFIFTFMCMFAITSTYYLLFVLHPFPPILDSHHVYVYVYVYVYAHVYVYAYVYVYVYPFVCLHHLTPI